MVLPALPTTASGKVDRAELGRLLAAEAAAAPAARRGPAR
jgi:hypothetical protein